MGGFEQFPQQGLEHAHAVVLQVFGQVGVVAGHQRVGLGFGQPDAAQAQHGRVDHVHQVGLEEVEGFGHRGPRQGQLELGVEGQRHGRHPHHLGPHVAGRRALRTEDQHLVAGRHQVLHRLGQPGDDPVDLGQEGFGEEGDFQGFRSRLRPFESPGPGCGSRPRCRGCGCGRSGRPSGGPHPPPRPAGRHRGWWG